MYYYLIFTICESMRKCVFKYVEAKKKCIMLRVCTLHKIYYKFYENRFFSALYWVGFFCAILIFFVYKREDP